jgi:Rrf2 family protein
MRLSKTATYALQVVLRLATANAGAPLTCRQIATEEGVPERYLMSVLRTLCRQRIIESVRGSEGGFRLSCKPGDISLADIVEAVDGPLLSGLPAGATLSTEIDGRLQTTLQQIARDTRRQLEALQVSDLLRPRAATLAGCG